MSARHQQQDEEGGGFRLPGLVIAFAGLVGVIGLLIWFGPRAAPAEAARDDPATAPKEGEPDHEAAVDPFADVPDEPPPKPRNPGPFYGLAVLTEAPAWVTALDHVESGQERVEKAYVALEERGPDGAKSDGYAARLGYLKALEGTEELVPWLEEITDEKPAAKEMLAQRAAWQKKVDQIDHDFELIPRD